MWALAAMSLHCVQKIPTHSLFQNLPFLRYIHCNFCLNLHIIHGDMKENMRERFFLNTVYNHCHVTDDL